MLTETDIRTDIAKLAEEELVQYILDLQEEARSEGWQEGCEEGYNTGYE